MAAGAGRGCLDRQTVHPNHAAGQIWDTIEFDKSIGVGRAFAASTNSKKNKDDTLVVVSADHDQSIHVLGVVDATFPGATQNIRNRQPFTGFAREVDGFPDYADANGDGRSEPFFEDENEGTRTRTKLKSEPVSCSNSLPLCFLRYLLLNHRPEARRPRAEHAGYRHARAPRRSARAAARHIALSNRGPPRPHLAATMNPLLAKTFSIETRELSYQLKHPYFLEDLLRPVFVWGVGIGTLLLITALLLKDVRLRVVALAVVLASSLVVIPYLKVRRKADDPAHGRAAPSAKITQLRLDTQWVYLTLAALAGGSVLWGRRNKLGPLLVATTLIGGVAGTSLGLWLEAYDAGAMHFTPGSKSPRKPNTP